jgi:hypothetical protein
MSQHQRREILQVQELYVLYIGGSAIREASLPDQIRFVTKKSGFLYIFKTKSYSPVNQSSALQYVPSIWEDKMLGSGSLRGYATDIISEICAYQQAKNLDSNTAECMFLEELKHWSTFELAHYSMSKDYLKLINDRVRYLEQVLAQENLFFSSKWDNRTVQQIIFEICNRLKYSVVPEIKNDLAIQSSREKLSIFKTELKLGLQQGIYFLYHVFRDSGKHTIDAVNIGKILQRQCPEITTTSGELLYYVLSSACFEDVFPDMNMDLRDQILNEKLDSEVVHNRIKMDESTLLTRDGNICMPASLWKLLTCKESKDTIVLLNKEKLSQVFSKNNNNTGLETGFLSHPYIAEQYIKAHAILVELAKFVNIIIKAEKCAAAGGDLLIYGFANKQLNALLDIYRCLIKKIRAQFEILMRIAELRFQQLVNQNKAQHTRNTWIPHYRNIHTKMYKFDNQLNRTEECVEDIVISANSLTLYERFQKLKTDTQDFITSADLYASHLNNILEIPYHDVLNDKIFVDGEHISSLYVQYPMLEQKKKMIEEKKRCDEDNWLSQINLLEENSSKMSYVKSAHPSLKKPSLVKPVTSIFYKNEPKIVVVDLTKLRLNEEDVAYSRVQFKIQNVIQPDTSDSSLDILLQYNQLNPAAIIVLLSFLTKNISKFRYINFCGNTMDAISAEHFSRFLSNPLCKLQHLDISNCRLDDTAFKYILESLSVNDSLQILMAQDNNFTDKTVKRLCANLLANPDSKCTTIAINNGDSNHIPYTDKSVAVLSTIMARKSTLCVQIHNDELPLSREVFLYADIFNNYSEQRFKRINNNRQYKRQILQDEQKQLKLCASYADLIRVCQVYTNITKQKLTPINTINNAFFYQAYGVKLDDNIQTYLHHAVKDNIIKFKGTEVLLSQFAENFIVNIDSLVDISSHWYFLTTTLLSSLNKPEHIHSIIQKLSDITKCDDETINQYVFQCVQAGLLLINNDKYFVNNITDSLPVDLLSTSYTHPLLLYSTTDHKNKRKTITKVNISQDNTHNTATGSMSDLVQSDSVAYRSHKSESNIPHKSNFNTKRKSDSINFNTKHKSDSSKQDQKKKSRTRRLSITNILG